MIKKHFNIIALLSFFCFISEKAFATPSMPDYSYSEMYMYDNQDSQSNYDSKSYETKISDPFYIINKNIFNINYIIDSAILSPLAETYIFIVPPHGRARIGDFMNNLGEPINFFNLLLQGKFSKAKISFARFITNSTLGCAGIMDVASKFKLEYYSEDFGQTLAHYKVPSGPYIVAPLFGPTNARDLSGKVVDFFINPFKYIMTKNERNIVNAAWVIHKRAEAKEIIKTINKSLNPYETAKTFYIQNRTSQINN